MLSASADRLFHLHCSRDDYYTPIPELHYGIHEASIIWAPGVAVSEHNMRVSGEERRGRDCADVCYEA